MSRCLYCFPPQGSTSERNPIAPIQHPYPASSVQKDLSFSCVIFPAATTCSSFPEMRLLFFSWVGALQNSSPLPCFSTLLRSRTSTSTPTSGAQAAPPRSRSPQCPGEKSPGLCSRSGGHRSSAGRPLLGASPVCSRGTGERRKPSGPRPGPAPRLLGSVWEEREPAWDRGEAARLHATLRAPLSGLCAPLAARPRPRPCAGTRGPAWVCSPLGAGPPAAAPRRGSPAEPAPCLSFLTRSLPLMRLRRLRCPRAPLSRPRCLRTQISICCGRQRPRPRRASPHGSPGHSGILRCHRGTGISYSSLPMITHSLQATPYASSDQTTRYIGTSN